jgi:hypothetical protein
MGAGRADDPASQARRATARCERPRDFERDLLRAVDRLSVAGLPKNLPPKSTAHYHFALWDWDCTQERLHSALYVATREREGREASPSAAIIDSQSARAAQTYGPPVCKCFRLSDLSSLHQLHQRMRSQGQTLAEMESRASRAS